MYICIYYICIYICIYVYICRLNDYELGGFVVKASSYIYIEKEFLTYDT